MHGNESWNLMIGVLFFILISNTGKWSLGLSWKKKRWGLDCSSPYTLSTKLKINKYYIVEYYICLLLGISEEGWRFKILLWVGLLLSFVKYSRRTNKIKFFFSMLFIIVERWQVAICFTWSDLFMLLTFVVQCFCWVRRISHS